MTYSKDSCLENINNKDRFIVGYRIDEYPAYEGLEAKTEEELLIPALKIPICQFLQSFPPGQH